MAPTFVSLPRRTFESRGRRRTYVYGALHEDWPARIKTPTSEPAALHKRFDLLTSTWVAISPARNERPLSAADNGEAVARPGAARNGDADGMGCPFCPGGAEIPAGYDSAVIENRFPTFVAEPPPVSPDPLVAPAAGRCEVILYTERHEASLATLDALELARVLAVWRDRSTELWSSPHHRFVLVFENRGDAVGATLSHPHGQIYAFDHEPPLIAARVEALARHRGANGTCLSCSVVSSDEVGARVITTNGSFLVAQPFAPRWPYEIHVRARRHGLRRLTDLDAAEQRDLASAIHEVTARYDGLFGFELPYMMSVMEAPNGANDWHLAVEFLPPHRSASLAKVRASVETTTGVFINDTLPEETARQLASIQIPARTEWPAMLAEAVPVDHASELE